MTSKGTPVHTVRLPPELAAQISAQAAQEGTSVSVIIRKAIRQYLGIPAVLVLAVLLTACGGTETPADDKPSQSEVAADEQAVAAPDDSAEVAAFAAELRETKAFGGEFKPTWAEAVEKVRERAAIVRTAPTGAYDNPDFSEEQNAVARAALIEQTVPAAMSMIDEIAIPLETAAVPTGAQDLANQTIAALDAYESSPTVETLAALDAVLAEWTLI